MSLRSDLTYLIGPFKGVRSSAARLRVVTETGLSKCDLEKIVPSFKPRIWLLRSLEACFKAWECAEIFECRTTIDALDLKQLGLLTGKEIGMRRNSTLALKTVMSHVKRGRLV